MAAQPPKLSFFHERTCSVLVRCMTVIRVCCGVKNIFIHFFRDTKRRSTLPWLHIRHSICRRPDSYTCSFLFYFCLFGDVAFSDDFVFALPFYLCMESTSNVLSFRMVFLYLVTMGWIFYINQLIMWEFTQSKTRYYGILWICFGKAHNAVLSEPDVPSLRMVRMFYFS